MIEKTPYVKTSLKAIYEKKVWYSITINPSDKYQYIGKSDRLKLVQNFIYEQMLPLRTSKIHYRYSLDISQPSKVGADSLGPRVHLHGRIAFACTGSILDWQLQHMYRLSRWGHVDIDTIKSLDEWDTYCDKYNHITKIPPQTSYETGINKKNIDFSKFNISSTSIEHASGKTSKIHAKEKAIELYTSEASAEDSEQEQTV